MTQASMIRTLVAWLLASACVASLQAAEPLHPLANPSLYEQQGYLSHVNTATGAVTISGKIYRANARTIVFIADGKGGMRKGLTLADIPENVEVSFATGADGTITQIFAGSLLLPAPR
jgi:hypothetical protein